MSADNAVTSAATRRLVACGGLHDVGKQSEHRSGLRWLRQFRQHRLLWAWRLRCVYLVSEWQWPLGAAAFIAGISVSLLALIFGLGILRLRGAFFALVTIGVNEAVKAFVANFEPWGGAAGIYLSLDVYEPLGGPGCGSSISSSLPS